MARRGTRRGRTVLLLLVVVVLVAGGVTWRAGLLDRWLDDDAVPSADPAAVAPPPGLDLPAVAAPAPVAATLPLTAKLSPAAVRRAVAKLLHDRDLGKHVRALVAPLDGGAPVYSQGSGPATPASTTKLLTTTAALLALGPDHAFTTKVVGRGDRVVLVGGGDPYLERRPDDPDLAGTPVAADVTTLAKRTAKRLARRGITHVRVGYDDSLFSGPAANPDWEKDYLPDGVVSPISALWVDEGRPESRYGRVADPAAEAARAFTGALDHQGIKVQRQPVPMRAHGATLASMESAPLSQIVERILDVSDNEGAEVLLRQTGLAQQRVGSFVAGENARADLLRQNGVPLGHGSVLHDGSGLARDDSLDPAALLAVLRLDASAEHPELRSVLSGLPVAGFSGSLADRMDHGPSAGLGRVRAKTGTLTGVSSLAGIANDLDGDGLVFVLMADRVRLPDTLDAREALDDAAAALGACHCSS